MVYCAYCKKESKRNKGLSFHVFPLKQEEKAKWIENMGRKNWTPSKYSVLCSNHFTRNCIDFRYKRAHLRKGSIPTVFETEGGNLNPVIQELRPAMIIDNDSHLNLSTTPILPVENCHNTGQHTNIALDKNILGLNHDHTYNFSTEGKTRKLESLAEKNIKSTKGLKNKRRNEERAKRKTEVIKIEHLASQIMKCRTCLRELDLNSKLSLTTNLPIGKTVEEIIKLFIPELVKSQFANNFICPQCMEKVQTFLKFIEKCISVENYLKQQEQLSKESKNVVSTPPLTTICIKKIDKSNDATDNLNANNAEKDVYLIEQECINYIPIKPSMKWLFTEPRPGGRHMRRNHEEKLTYRCENCNVVFKNKKAYSAHIEKYKLYKDCSAQKCRVCKETVSKHLYKKHVDSHKNTECHECKKKFSTVRHLKMHLKKHQNKNGGGGTKQKKTQKCLCPVCGKLLNHPSALHLHLRRHSENRSFLCSKCAKSFKTMDCLNRHMGVVHGEIGYECLLCRTKTRSAWALQNHIRLKHSTAYSRVCNVCGKGFGRNDYYRRHLKQHQDKTNENASTSVNPIESSLPCKHCNEKFKTIGQLRGHVQRAHVKNPARHSCQYCNMTFSFLTNKIRHEKRHKDPRDFELTCKACWRKFDTKETLDEHYMKHKVSPKYKCDLCDEMLPTKFWLMNHRAEKHLNEQLAA